MIAGMLAACGGGPEATRSDVGELSPVLADEGGPDASQLGYVPCPREVGVGQFVIELASDYTRVGGKVSDGVLPTRVPTELAREGDCRLLETVPASCSPGCSVATEICNQEQTCVPLPRAHDVGTVSVTGLVAPLAMRANSVTGSYSNPAQPALPHPGFISGADLRLGASGGDYTPFVLRGWGVSPLELEPGRVEIRSEAPVSVAWSVPGSTGPARLHVELNINHHGSSNAWIECDFSDTGSAVIPAPLVDGLMAEGLSGFPTLVASRRTATSVAIAPGCVELLVVSEVVSGVDVDGILSCNTSAECPSGLSCLPVERFCQ